MKIGYPRKPKTLSHPGSYGAGFKYDLTVHMNSIHLGIRYLCNECGKEFRRKSLMKKHSENCNNINYVFSSDNIRNCLQRT